MRVRDAWLVPAAIVVLARFLRDARRAARRDGVPLEQGMERVHQRLRSEEEREATRRARREAIAADIAAMRAEGKEPP
jgi:hypothetical protein